MKESNRNVTQSFDPENKEHLFTLIQLLEPLLEGNADDREIIEMLTKRYRSSNLFDVIKSTERIIYG